MFSTVKKPQVYFGRNWTWSRFPPSYSRARSVNKSLMEREHPNEPLGRSDEVRSDGSESDSDRKWSWECKISITKLNNEVHKMRLIITILMDQNQLLVEIIKSERSSSSDATGSTYMKNVLKPMTWNNKKKKNIELLLTTYETYCDVSGYNDDDIRVWSFRSFLKNGESIASAAWRGRRH